LPSFSSPSLELSLSPDKVHCTVFLYLEPCCEAGYGSGRIWFWLDMVMDRYGSGQIWFWPDMVLARYGSGQIWFWPNIVLTRYGSDQIWSILELIRFQRNRGSRLQRTY
jgi:hypothetical protein